MSLRHENAIERSDFRTDYQETASETPLGAEPALLARARIDERTDGARIICLAPKEDQGLQLALDDRLAHAFVSLLRRANAVTGWDLDLRLAAAVAEPAAERTMS